MVAALTTDLSMKLDNGSVLARAADQLEARLKQAFVLNWQLEAPTFSTTLTLKFVGEEITRISPAYLVAEKIFNQVKAEYASHEK